MASSKAQAAHPPTRTHRRARTPLAGAITFGVIVGSVLLLAGSLLVSAFSRPKLAPLAGTVIDIAADMSGFDMEVVQVKVGEPVTIRLTSLDNSHHTDGGGKHQWAVDELSLDLVTGPESSNTLTFTPNQAGSYVFYCDICCGGRANPTMQGTLTVET